MTKCLAYYHKLVEILDKNQPNWITGTEIAGNTILAIQDTFCKDVRSIQRDIAHLRKVNKIKTPKKAPKKHIKLTEKEKQVERINNWIKERGLQPDEFDIEALVDSSLTYSENLYTIMCRYTILKVSETEHIRQMEKFENTSSYDRTVLQLEVYDYELLLDLIDKTVDVISSRNREFAEHVGEILYNYRHKGDIWYDADFKP